MLHLHGALVDEVRAALEWAFSPNGSESLGLGLTIAAVPLWLNLSLMDECRHRVKSALSRGSEAADTTPIDKLKLLAALGVALYSIGPSPESKRVWTQSMRIATRLKNTDYRLRGLWIRRSRPLESFLSRHDDDSRGLASLRGDANR